MLCPLFDAESHNAECHYTKFHYAKCHVLCVMLSVFMRIVILLRVIWQIVIVLSVIWQNVLLYAGSLWVYCVLFDAECHYATSHHAGCSYYVSFS